MRKGLLIAVTTAVGLGACAPIPSAGYGYATAPQPAVAYGYEGGYAPQPYYAEPVYAAPYVAPGPTIIIGGERRYGDRYRYDRPHFERPHFERDGGYRGPYPGREFGHPPGPRSFGGGGRPGPTPVGADRPAPPQHSAPPQGRPAPGGDHGRGFNPGGRGDR